MTAVLLGPVKESLEGYINCMNSLTSNPPIFTSPITFLNHETSKILQNKKDGMLYMEQPIAQIRE